MIGSMDVTAQFDVKGRVSTPAPSHTHTGLQFSQITGMCVVF